MLKNSFPRSSLCKGAQLREDQYSQTDRHTHTLSHTHAHIHIHTHIQAQTQAPIQTQTQIEKTNHLGETQIGFLRCEQYGYASTYDGVTS